MFTFKRHKDNPIFFPTGDHPWESEAAFNGCPAMDGKTMHFVYRAIGADHASTVGYASSQNGVDFKNRKQLIRPEHDWEKYGCEDPRITKFGSTYYIFYTALSEFPFRAEGIKVALATTKDFKTLKKFPVTTFNAKAMALFPEKINGKMVAILTANTDRPPVKVGLAFFDKPEDIVSPNYWDEWYANVDKHRLVLERSDRDHVEVGSPPIKTKYGWLLFYSYIQNYFAPPATFGIEAVLLDLKDPTKIIGRTTRALMVPDAEYEKYGMVQNIAFPTGAVLRGDIIHMYYGAADTVCAVATGSLKELAAEMLANKPPEPIFERFEGNPIITPDSNHPWEAKATFNAGAIYINKKVHLFYRAMGHDNTSVLGYATSSDGTTITERDPEPAYKPRADFERKKNPGGNSGCEDPRLTRLGGTIYMLYTAYDGQNPPRVAMTSISDFDFKEGLWDWSKPVLISPPGVDDKDSAIFPKKINGKFAILHRLGESIWLDFVDSLDFDGSRWLAGKVLMHPDTGLHESRRIGIAGPPIETKYGWLLIYHAISTKSDNHYHLSAVLLDLKDPTKIIARAKDPILEVEMPYEKSGQVSNVVFSNGAVVIGKKLYLYYGAADSVLGVAVAPLEKLLKKLVRVKK